MAKQFSALNQGLLIAGMFVLVLGGMKYIQSQFDIIPDSVGPVGFVDDIIAIFMLLYGANWLYRRIKERLGGTREGMFKFFDSWPLSRLLTSLPFWVSIAWVVGVIFYFNWANDLMPDPIPGFGILDDVVLAFAAFKPVYNMFTRRKE